jgi:luciferase family oxidoreductase group 1
VTSFPVSVLDLSLVDSGSTGPQALLNTIEIAQAAERLGYSRIWLAEHHNTAAIASPAPEIMIGVLARETSTIRIGSGGIMLPNHSPLKVAESFRVLEALAPGRVDLGIGRAPGTDTMTALALRRSREALAADDFPEQLAELRGYNDPGSSDHPFMRIKASPSDVPLPPIWILGSSDYGARLAAALGLPFSFASHINMEMAVPALRYYRDAFVPSETLQTPLAMLAVSIICAPTAEDVADLQRVSDLSMLRLITGQFGPIPSIEEARAYPFTERETAAIQGMRSRRIAGTPDQVLTRIEELVAATGADEVMISSMVWGHQNRLRALELMAEAFELPGVTLARSTTA